MANLIIDGVSYGTPIIALQRTADVLDKKAGRTEDGGMYREVIGTYINYTCSFGYEDSVSEYNALFNVLASPTAFHEIKLPISNEYCCFTGYISSVYDEIDREEDDGTHFKALTCQFTAKLPSIYA